MPVDPNKQTGSAKGREIDGARTQAKPRLLVCGPTASGKTRVAVAVAKRIGGEVISVDSMKIYRDMTIGTAKASEAKRGGVPFHLFDVREPHQSISVADFVTLAEIAEAQILARGNVPIFCGGTALYLRALTEGLFEGPPRDEDFRARLRAEAAAHGRDALHARLRAVDSVSAAKLHPNDLRRVIRALEVFAATGTPISALQQQWKREPRPDRLLFGLGWEREALYARIGVRVDAMMQEGFLGEVRGLHARKRPLSPESRQALGYRELLAWIEGGEAEPEADVVETIKRNTRRFAKRQLTFFRHFPDLRWLPVDDATEADELADAIVGVWLTSKLG